MEREPMSPSLTISLPSAVNCDHSTASYEQTVGLRRHLRSLKSPLIQRFLLVRFFQMLRHSPGGKYANVVLHIQGEGCPINLLESLLFDVDALTARLHTSHNIHTTA